jgi:hypothetical protein
MKSIIAIFLVFIIQNSFASEIDLGLFPGKFVRAEFVKTFRSVFMQVEYQNGCESIATDDIGEINCKKHIESERFVLTNEKQVEVMFDDQVINCGDPARNYRTSKLSPECEIQVIPVKRCEKYVIMIGEESQEKIECHNIGFKLKLISK